ncbi:MAG: hypothetical protein ABIT20_11510 [Gemmatimonadaceae bacterium]
MADPLNCLRCQTPMEPGFVADRTYGGWVEAQWSQGKPDAHWWGLAKPADAIKVTTMRCPRCGTLESIAPPS